MVIRSVAVHLMASLSDSFVTLSSPTMETTV